MPVMELLHPFNPLLNPDEMANLISIYRQYQYRSYVRIWGTEKSGLAIYLARSDFYQRWSKLSI
jgi:hypothetical protein